MLFNVGLSGMNAAQAALDVLGGNIANTNTVGYKESNIAFTDVMSNSLAGSAAGVSMQVGTGTTASLVHQTFTQGTITSTGNPLDMAIKGSGFFQIQDPATGNISYTRNGQFKLDSSGNVINANNQLVNGFPVTGFGANGTIVTGAAAPLNISQYANITATPTSTVAVNVNVDATSKVPTGTLPTATPFTTSDWYNYSTTVKTYSQNGGAQDLQLYFAKSSATANTWNIYSSVGGSLPTSLAANVAFNADGSLTTAAVDTLSSLSVTLDPTMTTAATLDLSKMTATAAQNYVTSATQNGYAGGSLAGFTIDTGGSLRASYSNGQTDVLLGQVALANFAAPNGLKYMGDGTWQATAASGLPVTGAPGTGSFGSIQASSVESSNVDETRNLVGLLAAQRAYQANAQTIKAQDTLAQTMVNLGA